MTASHLKEEVEPISETSCIKYTSGTVQCLTIVA
jgi:hypothetical protein